MDEPWTPCHYGHSERAYVEWYHFDAEHERWTCYHHARTLGPRMVAAGWARITEEEWLTEPSRLEGAL